MSERVYVLSSSVQPLHFWLAMMAFATLLTSCKSDYSSAAKPNPMDTGKAAKQVKTVSVVETPFGETVTANGTLAAFDQTTVSVKVPGRLHAISVDLGSVVRQGQLIAEVESEDYKLRVQQA